MSEPEKVASSLKWGADPNRLVGKYNVPAKNFMDLMDAVLHPEKKPSTAKPILALACGIGNSEAVEILLKHGADKNYIMTDGQSPLHSAAKRSTSETIKVLINYRANSALKDKLGRTPLHIAANNESVACTEALLAYGAKMDVLDKANYTPLMTAIFSGKPKSSLFF